MSEPFKAARELGDGTWEVYTIATTVVTSRNGDKQLVHFFMSSTPRRTLAGCRLHGPVLRMDVPNGQMMQLVRALITVGGLTTDQAVGAVVRLKRDVAQLTPRQMEDLERYIRRELGG